MGSGYGGRGQNIAEGLNQVGEGLKGFADWQLRAKETQAKLEQMQLYKQQIQQQMDEHNQKVQEVATNQWGDMLLNAASSKDPKKAISLYSQRLNTLMPHVPGASSMTQEDLEQQVSDLSVNLEKPLQVLKQSQAALLNPGTTDEAASQAYQAAKDALGEVKAASPYSMQPIWSTKMDALDQMAEKRFSARMAEKANQAKLEAVKETAANKPQPETAFQKKQRSVQADTYAKALDALPAMQQDAQNLDNAMKIADRVFTGPLAGKSIAYGLQKISSEDAQQLNYYLSKENVIKIMEFAKSAGVRAIDTPQEQQRLLDSIANKEQSPKVLKKNLQQMKMLQEQAIRLTQAKQAHVNQYGNLDTFNPLSANPAPQQEHPLINKLKF